MFKVEDADGNLCNIRLASALFIPSFRQNIFSVQSAVKEGAQVLFNESLTELRSPCGKKFPIVKRGKLYYINSQEFSCYHIARVA